MTVTTPAIVLRAAGAATVVAFLAAAFTPLPAVLARWMSVTREPERAAAIVVLGADGVRPDGTLGATSLRRALHGMSLYRRGLAPVLVFSGPAFGTRRAEAAVRADLARECDVPAAAILTASRGRTTREEALDIDALLRPRGIRRILLVSDALSMTRAAGAFAKAGFEVVPAPTDGVFELRGGPENRLDLARDVGLALGGWIYYRIAGFL